jgi:hypothetical protein
MVFPRLSGETMSSSRRRSPIKFKSLCPRSGRLNRTEIQSMIDELAVGISLYQKRADYTWHPGVPQTRLGFARANQRMRHLKQAFKTAPPELNPRGNQVYRWFRETSSYRFASALPAQGYRQYDTDQDAAWFGVWINVEAGKIFTFAEGDCILVSCPTRAGFISELTHMESFYGSAPEFMRVLGEDGTVTRYVDVRPGAELLVA